MQLCTHTYTQIYTSNLREEQHWDNCCEKPDDAHSYHGYATGLKGSYANGLEDITICTYNLCCKQCLCNHHVQIYTKAVINYGIILKLLEMSLGVDQYRQTSNGKPLDTDESDNKLV